MPKPHNIHALPKEHCAAYGKGAVTKTLSALAGSQKLNVNADVVPPGAYSTLYHSHSLQEEFFLILQGEGTLRTPEGEFAVKEGDFWAKPAGPQFAHTFYNSGTGDLHILDIATVQAGDVVHYPDDDIYWLHNSRTAVSESGVPAGWTNEPNAKG